MKYLVFDSNSILNRAFYGVRLLTAKDGSFTNAVYGFFNISLKLIDELRPDRVVFAFDLPGGTFRNQLYDGYKANRKGMPPELAQQLPVVKQLIRDLGYPIAELAGYEADDILGTISAHEEAEGDDCLLATGDRDSLQLVSDRVTVILASTKAGGAEYIPMDPAAVAEKYGGLQPHQLIDVKALMGDSSDNIPGVAGIGEKGALSLIQKYGSLDEIYRDVDALDITAGMKKKLTEGREMAYLSRKLGEICREAPIDCCGSAFERSAMDEYALYTTLSRLELHRLIQRLGLKPTAAPARSEESDTPPAPAVTYTLVEGWPGAPSGDCYILWEDKYEAVAIVCGESIYLPADTASAVRELFSEDNKLYVSDSKPLYKLLLREGIFPRLADFDLRLAAYLLSPNSSEYTVERLAGEYGVARPEISGEGCESARTAAGLPALCSELQQMIEKNEQDKLLREVEQPLARVLADMELIGFRIDLEGLRSFGEELTGLISGLEKEIYTLAGGEFNINSPKQLGEVLFERLGLPARRKTKSGYSTDADVLDSLVPYHEIVGKILDYRKYAKLKSTYVDGLEKAAGSDSRIRTSFQQTETRTGRLSSTEPNMQNIPVRTEPGSRMREFFTAAEGCMLVDADYSQIELRVLAAVAGDRNMINAFLSGEDIHTTTASQVFDLPPLFVTPLMRSRAKAVNFGIVYGIGAFSLSKDIGVSVAEADSYIKGYLRTYSGVSDYMKRTVEEAKEKGYAETLLGRRRYLPELTASNHNMRAFGERVARNMPIQGTAADIIKIAMVRVEERLRGEGMKARLILQVHDELIVEAPEEEAERARQIVREEMEGAITLAVPMEVDAKIGHSWAEAH